MFWFKYTVEWVPEGHDYVVEKIDGIVCGINYTKAINKIEEYYSFDELESINIECISDETEVLELEELKEQLDK